MIISNFYDNRELFITGGTGFLGKSLLEKLLRDCPGIHKIYLLIRPKKGKTAQDRLDEFQKELVFDRVNRERPGAFKKVIPIIGNCHEIGLGISQSDLEQLKNVSVVFHGAAYVKFDNDLRSSVLMNTRGTHELVKIALNFKNIVAFIHVSTAYIYPQGTDIEEKLYKLPNDWRETIRIAETYDTDTLEAIKQKFTDFSPNVYTFTKNLSEQVINDYSDRLPMSIVRPAVVSQSYRDPEPGFFDNLNGPMGLLATIVLGLGQMTYCDPDVNLSLIPVDIITCLTITDGCKRGLATLNSKNSPMTIRNFAPGDIYLHTIQQASKKLVQLADKNPMQYVLWSPATRMTTNYSWYMVWVFFVLIPMALFYDTLLVLFKKDAMVLKTVRRLIYTVKALSKFSTKYFNIRNDGMWELLNYIQQHDKEEIFYVVNPRNVDFEQLFVGLLHGFKKYIFKEPVEATPKTLLRYKVAKYLSEFVKLILFLLLIKFLWNLVN